MNFKNNDLKFTILKVNLTFMLLLSITYQSTSQSLSMGCGRRTYLYSTGTVTWYPPATGSDSIKVSAFPWDLVNISPSISTDCFDKTMYLLRNGVVIDTVLYPGNFNITSSGFYVVFNASTPVFPSCIIDFVNPTNLNETRSVDYNYYPNPVFDFLQFDLPLNGQYRIQISNNLTNVLTSYISKEKSQIDLRNLSQGIFYFQLYKDEKYVGSGKFIKLE